MTKHASELKMPQPVAWLCEFQREDGATIYEVVLYDPACTRWADMPDGDGVSPYKVTPLYAEPDILPRLREAEALIKDIAECGNFSSGLRDRARTYADKYMNAAKEESDGT